MQIGQCNQTKNVAYTKVMRIRVLEKLLNEGLRNQKIDRVQFRIRASTVNQYLGIFYYRYNKSSNEK